MQLRDARHNAGGGFRYGEDKGKRGEVMNKLLIILALALALAGGTVVDAITIAQAAHADCITAK
jgi:hypothetical protein